MKKILISLSIVGAVAAIAIGATTAYFSDTETSTGNTIAAGTIDLAVNGQNPLTGKVIEIKDVKPSENVADTEVLLNNVGSNDGVADLHILAGVGMGTGGILSEPECVAEGGIYDGQCTGSWVPTDNICDVMQYDYTYDANGNGVKDENGDIHGYLKASQNVYLDVLPAGITRKLWLSHHLSGDADNKYQGDICTYDIEFSLRQLSGDPDSPVISFVDVGNTNSEDSKDMKGWSSKVWPAAGGVWGGGDDGTIRTVSAGQAFDNYKSTLPNIDDATVVMDFGASGAKNLIIRHLDGAATNDSFDVYVDGNKVGNYVAKGTSPEVWVTTSFPVTDSGVHTVRIQLTGSHWTYYDDWGQLGISWIKIVK